MAMNTKTCFKCKKRKPRTSFYRHRQMGDGLLGKCKACTKSDVAKHYRDTFPARRAYERKRSSSEARRRLVMEYQARMRKRYPGKYKARSKLLNAIRDGRMDRGPCEVCGSKKSQAHHSDYRKPLNVRWLCFKHHREIHGQLRHTAKTGPL